MPPCARPGHDRLESGAPPLARRPPRPARARRSRTGRPQRPRSPRRGGPTGSAVPAGPAAGSPGWRRPARAPTRSQNGRPRRARAARPARVRAQRAQHDARLDHPVPAVALEPQRDVVACSARRRERLRRRAEGHPARSRAAGGDEREARVLACSSPMPATFSKRAAGTSSVGCGLPIPNGRSALELVGQLEPEHAAGHHGVDALARGSGRRAPAPRRRGRRARGGRARPRPPRARPRRPCGGRRSGSRCSRAGGRGPRAGRRRRCCGPSRGRRRPRQARSPRRAAASARPAATPRSRPRPDASPPPPPRSRPGCACGAQAASAANRMRVSASRRSRLSRSSSRATSLGAGVVLGEQQLERGVRAPHPAGGVDARAEPEAERVLGQLRRAPRRRPPSARAGPACACAPSATSALADDAPVLVAQRHEVADGGERGQVEVLGRLGRRRGRRRRAAPRASFSTTPDGAQLGAAVGCRAPGCTTAQSGSSSPGRWWSVTTTSSPAARAAATCSTAVIPQSTVTSSRTPRPASRSTAAPERP